MGEAGIKERVRDFWEETPCGTRDLDVPEGSPEYFARLDLDRDRTQPFVSRFARFEKQRGKRVLEVGVGPATDFVRFARAGARLTGVDLTAHAVELARRRLEFEGLQAELQVADGEGLPFGDDEFDFVYSWGVVHHTERPEDAIREIARVTKPGGEVCVMVYHRRSLVALQSWIVNGLLRGRPWLTFGEVIWNHHESIGTRAYTIAEARLLVSGLEDVRVTPVVTAFDVRVTRTQFAPRWVQRLVPSRLGWFLVVEGRKP